MYREGTDVYAVDSYSAPSKGVCLTNLVTNGDLSLDGNFDGLADNWSASNVVSKSLSNNTQSFIASASWAGAGTTVASKVVGDSYYTSALVRASSNIVVLGNNVGSVTYHSGSGNYERLSTVVVANINTLAPTIYDLRSSGWDTVYVRYVLCIDLTATFGAGYELTKAQMDTIMNGYSNNWFNITTKVSL
jgi:hypothetical protein